MQLLLRGAGARTQCVDVTLDCDVLGLKESIQARTGIPVPLQGLVFGGRQLQDNQPLDVYALQPGSTVQLVYRLLGGKGGFGALLRGQGRDGKVTTNFDACRDLSGRRLRHSLTEEKLAEWRASAKERELEEIAQRFLKEEARKSRVAEQEQVDVESIRAAQEDALMKTQQAVLDALNNNTKPAAKPTVAGSSGSGTSVGEGSSSPSAGTTTAAAGAKRKAEEPNAKPSSAPSGTGSAPVAKKSKMLAMLEDLGSDISSDDE